MVITFSAILFTLFFIFRGLQKNIFFIFFSVVMIFLAYWCENHYGWKVSPFSQVAFLLFLLFYLPLINLFTFLAYGRDKKLAKHNQWRIPELHLHTLELLGGTIGAVIGQKVFHHKNKKKSYMATFWATVFIQLFLILFILYRLKFI